MSDAASQFRDYVGIKEGHIDVENKSKKGRPVLDDQEAAAVETPNPEATAAGREDAVSRADKPKSGAKKATAKKATTASGEAKAKKAPAKKAAAKKTAAKKTATSKK